METKQITASLEDYLEAIFNIIEEKHGIKAIDVSRRLKVNRSSVTEALKNLAAKNMINYGRYDVISLTKSGTEVAKKIIEKHKALYIFFEKVLGLNPEEAQENACRIEHVISEEAFQRLIAFTEFNNKLYASKINQQEFHNFYKTIKKD